MGELVSRELLREDREGSAKSYTLTAKGLDFLHQMKETEAYAASLGLTM